MSERDRSVSTALGVTLCIALVWALGVWAGAYYQGRWNDYDEGEAQPYSGPLQADQFWASHAATPKSYQAICQSPKDAGQADLCQQWRSANAAKETSGYTLVSLLFGLAGLIGVGISVRLSIRATEAATTATNAAVESNRISREIAGKELRAYVGPTGVTLTDFVVGRRPKIIYRPKNSGQTPAFGFVHVTTFRTQQGLDADKAKIRFADASEGQGWVRADLAAGESYEQVTTLPELNAETLADFLARRRPLIFIGLIKYRDVFNVQRRTIFRYKLDPDHIEDGHGAMMLSTRHNRSS